jgi:hypothetical protein
VAEQLVVDANPVLAALLGGRAREIFFSGLFQFCSPQAALFEVAKYIPAVAKQAHCPRYIFIESFNYSQSKHVSPPSMNNFKMLPKPLSDIEIPAMSRYCLSQWLGVCPYGPTTRTLKDSQEFKSSRRAS